MSKLVWVVIAIVLAALGLGAFVVLGDDDADDTAVGTEGDTTETTDPDEEASEPTGSSANSDFCRKFSTLASAQSSAASRMTSIFRDLTDDSSTPDAAAIATDLRAFITRITDAAALEATAPAEIASDYAIVEVGLTGATVPYGKLATAAEESLSAAKTYANGAFMDDLGNLITDEYLDSGEKVEAWVDANCG